MFEFVYLEYQDVDTVVFGICSFGNDVMSIVVTVHCGLL